MSTRYEVHVYGATFDRDWQYVGHWWCASRHRTRAAAMREARKRLSSDRVRIVTIKAEELRPAKAKGGE